MLLIFIRLHERFLDKLCTLFYSAFYPFHYAIDDIFLILKSPMGELIKYNNNICHCWSKFIVEWVGVSNQTQCMYIEV
jgi:hypothetical protein